MDKDAFIKIVEPYSMTGIARITELYNSLEYIRINNIQGDFVECGVWKGGNILGIMEYLNYYGIYANVWAYDTFEGMTKPDDKDIDCFNKNASDVLTANSLFLCYSSLSEVKLNLSKSKFPKENLKYIIGDVIETLNHENNLPIKISLLRLDTDWYKSTKKEIEILYPLLENNGVLIVDDYGHWMGSRQAIDEYFQSINIVPNIKQIDYTGIKILKNEH
jgi:hypothetical protein